MDNASPTSYGPISDPATSQAIIGECIDEVDVDNPVIDLGPDVDYEAYGDDDLVEMISAIPVLAGQIPAPGSIVLIGYVRAEPMLITIDTTQASTVLALREAVPYMAQARADAVLVLGVLADHDADAVGTMARRLLELGADPAFAAMSLFTVVIDDFSSAGQWIRAEHVEPLRWTELLTRRPGLDWTRSPLTQAAVAAGSIATPHSAYDQRRWAPASMNYHAEPIDPSDVQRYTQFTTQALGVILISGLDGFDDPVRAVIAATYANQLGEIITAYGPGARSRAIDDFATLAACSRRRIRSHLLTGAAVMLHSDGETEQARAALRAIDDIASSGGRTPLSQSLLLRLDDEIDLAQYHEVLRMADLHDLIPADADKS